MPDSPYSQLRDVQFRGPTDSEDYNSRIEENYKDLLVLINRARMAQANMDETYSRVVKEQYSLLRALEDLESRVDTLEIDANTLTFYRDTQVDNDRFAGGPYSITEVNQLNVDDRHGVITLPLVETSGLSKLSFANPDGEIILPSTLETKVVGVTGSADQAGAVIDTSEPELAIAHTAGRIWERNVIVPAPVAGGAKMYLYVKAPTDLFTTDKSNCITLHPYPALETDILEIAYTTKADVALDDGDGYTVLNSSAVHAGDPNAVGWVPPGGWNGDTALNAGPKVFYFDPKPITGLRIKLGQRNYYRDNGQFIYSYGLSNLDLRYDKFLATGKALIRFDVPSGHTISNVTSVQPQIWNVSEAEIPRIFSYRKIWETSFNSGSYTTSNVASSKRVWIEVTLNQTSGGGSPALSGLTLTYT